MSTLEEIKELKKQVSQDMLAQDFRKYGGRYSTAEAVMAELMRKEQQLKKQEEEL
jgi:hypothetical protein